MSAQIPDEIRYRGRLFALTAVEGVGGFDPAEHGLNPRPAGTACWFVAGRLTGARDLSADLDAVRDTITAAGPEPGESTRDWITRTFSLTFAYSWPGLPSGGDPSAES